MQIKTQRLLIREFKRNDVESIHIIAKKDGFNFYSLDGTHENAHNFVQMAINHAQKGTVRQSFKMAVEHEGNCIGYVALDDINGIQRETPDIGYLIDPSYQGNGFATEAMQGLIRHSFNAYKFLDDLWLTVHPDNIASQRVADKIGFKRQGNKIHEKTYGSRYVYWTNRTNLILHNVI